MAGHQSGDLKTCWTETGSELQRAIDTLHAIQLRGQAQIEDLESREAKLEAEKKQLEADKALLREQEERLADLRSQLEEEKCRMKKAGIGDSDLISLNLGGEHVVTVKRSLLIQFPDSMLANMFSGRYEDQLDRDKDGNVFLDYSPKIMMPLIEYFRLCRDSREAVPLPAIEAGLQKSWHCMLRFFGLSDLLPVTFCGIKQDVKICELTGWSMLFCMSYSHVTRMEDLAPPNGQDGQTLIVAARKAGSDILAVAAMGRADIVTKARGDQTHLHNGAHWYCSPDKAFGFAPDANIQLRSADTAERHDELRLSWHLNGDGGWRAGSAADLHRSTAWEKVIFISSAALPD